MRIIKLFDKYFLILMIIQGLISIFIDSRRFSMFNMRGLAKKAKVIGGGSIVISTMLYIVTEFIV